MKRPGLTLALLALVLPAQAQNPAPPPVSNFKQLISGSAFPTTLKMKSLDAATWRRFSIPSTGDSGMSSLFLIAAMAGGGGGNDPPANDGTVYYTQGDTVMLGGETFVVAYRPQLKEPNLMPMLMHQQQNPNPAALRPEKMTPETSIALALLNVRMLKNISDIKPFDLQKEIAESEANAKAMEAMMQQAVAVVAPQAVVAEKPPLVAPKVREAIKADKQLKADGSAIEVIEEENLIRLQGEVSSEAIKKHAEEVARKLLKDRGIGFQVKNELTVKKATSKAAPDSGTLAAV